MKVKFKNRLERNKPGSVRILNRIVTVTDQGWEHEDQRHAEILMKDMCIDECSKGVVTSGVVSASAGGQGSDGEARQQGGGSLFRAVAARGNYLGQDRMDMQFAAKEVSRFMSEEQDWSSAKRLARYFEDTREW